MHRKGNTVSGKAVKEVVRFCDGSVESCLEMDFVRVMCVPRQHVDSGSGTTVNTIGLVVCLCSHLMFRSDHQSS